MSPRTKPVGKHLNPPAAAAPAALRRAAEARLEARPTPRAPQSEADLRRLQHELEVHQIELEMQNEELRAAKAELSASVERYTDLYDFAPAGYLTLASDGTIELANFAGATLLGLERGRLVGRRFGLFVAEADRPAFAALLTRTFASEDKQTAELLLATGRVVRLKATRTPDGQRCRVMLVDITERHEAEAALKQQRAELQLVLDSVPALIFYKDREGRFLQVNQCLAQAVGLPVEAFLGKTDAELGSRFAELYRADDERVMSSGLSVRHREEQLHTATGDRWLQTDKMPLRDEAGRVVGVIGLSVDITERKRAEVALLASELRYRRLFEAAKDGILILDADTGMIVDVNPFLVELLGFSHAGFLGKKVWELGFFKDIIANEANFAELQAKEYIRYEDMALETHDGRRIEVEFISNVYRVNGHKVIQCNIRDNTERKQAAAALRGSEGRFRAFVTASSDVMYRMSPDWRVMRQLEGRGFIVDTLQPSETWFEGYIHPDDQPHVMAAIQEAIRTKGVFELEHRVRRVDGTLGWTFSRAVPLLDAKGEIAEWFGAASDVTERRQAEQELAESREQLRALLARLQGAREAESLRISREIHDVLGHLLTGLKLELRGLEKPVASVREEALREALATRLAAARQLSQSTVDAVKKIALELLPTVLDQLGLAAALDCTAREFQQHTGIPCVLTLADGLPALEPDRAAAVFRIFEEALTNIARHAGATQVRVRLAIEDGQLVLTVSDNGRGLPAAGTQKAGSLGVLGMHERALMAGGELRLHGPPGEGTTVTVSLALPPKPL